MKRGDRGFTLIEMVVALGVLLVGMVSVLALFTTAISLHKEAIDQTESSLIAEQVMTRIRGQVDAGRDPKAVAQAFADWKDPDHPNYRVTAELADVHNAAAEPEWLLSIHVRFQKGNRERQETYRTILVREAYAAAVRKAGTP
ncbi:MAG: prepilin-type N-terminal cleavage/methylation domain-containing protein [Planctomycetes bacterium]|nr:prepilin-type N-terminal cleavage/methylation domain-containing protein [Planctomycetota bacterium]MBI3846794.1 prepilin-type N-terminal cleavage/methylation domain-containing protein [Planctomycetota bacterium]